jgi:hypothetical protein
MFEIFLRKMYHGYILVDVNVDRVVNGYDRLRVAAFLYSYALKKILPITYLYPLKNAFTCILSLPIKNFEKKKVTIDNKKR